MLLLIAARAGGETLDEIDRLFALPLDEFTRARNDLAKRLKQDGSADAAEQVRTLAKPSVAAWAVNQLARQEAEGVRSLLNVGARLRSAQERSLRGERAADEVRAAQAEEREVLRSLTQRAGELLREAGRPATGATLDRVSSTLRAAALAEPGRTQLREGRLAGDVEVSGFDAFAGIEVPAGRRRRAAKDADADDLAERRRRKRELDRQRRALVKRLGQLEARADAAEREAHRARIAANEAEAAAAERRREAEAAAAELEQLAE